MRILFYGINYAPEITGIGKYSAEMCEYFAAQGNTMHVITAMPYYPKWERDSQYRGKWWHQEIIEKVKVFRCPIYVPKAISPLSRMLHEFSFIFSSFIFWLPIFFSKKYDVVISVSPPFHLGIFPLIYSRIRQVPLIVHIQDLQIDVAKGLNMLKNKYLLNLMFSVERFILRHATAVTSISLDMRMKIISKGVDSAKCFFFPNWVDEHKIRPVERNQSLRKAFGINATDKVVLFSGSLGEKHGLENMIECAKALSNTSDLLFVIVGSGEGEKNLKASVKKSGLANVLFFPLQTYENLSALLAIADLHLILLRKVASDLVMPSKLTSVLAAGGVPIVTAARDSNIYHIVSKNNLGIVVEPDDVNSLISGIKKGLETDGRIYSANARRYAENFLSKQMILRQWEQEVINIARHYKHPDLHKDKILGRVIKQNREKGVTNIV